MDVPDTDFTLAGSLDQLKGKGRRRDAEQLVAPAPRTE